MSRMKEPQVYSYFDYRLFLRERQVWLKSREPSFTLEYVAEQLGIRSRGHVSLILNGGCNIPEKRIGEVAEVFGLAGQEREFFFHLVQYQQEDSFARKKESLDRMVALMLLEDRRLVPSQYRLCEEWHTPVILEILRGRDIADEWSLLARCVRFGLTGAQAKEAVQVLSDIGLVKLNEKGFWKPTDKVVTFGDRWKDPAVRNFQAHSLMAAREALVSVDPAERDISTMVVSMSEATVGRIKDVLHFARQEVLALVKADQGSEKVYQLSLALFPVSQLPEREA